MPTTTFNVVDLTPNTKYNFTINAIDTGGATSSVGTIAVTTASVPSKPGNLASTDVTETSVALTWDTVSGATGYNVYSGNTKVGSVASNSFTVTGLTAGTSYIFTVTATNAGGESSASNPVNLTTVGSNRGNLPSGNSVSSNGSEGSSSSGSYSSSTSIGSTTLNSTGTISTTIEPDGTKIISPVIPVTVGSPSVPTSMEPTSGDREVAVSCSPVNGATGYNVYVNGVKVNNQPITSLPFVIPNLTNGQTYSVTITAINNAGESQPATTLNVKPSESTATTPKYASPKVSHRDSRTVSIAFQYSTGAVERENSNGTWIVAGDLKNGVFADKISAPGVYKYRIFASDGYSDVSSITMQGSFSDVPVGSFASNEIYDLAGKGIVSGYPKTLTGKTLFKPNNPITRAEFATMIAKSLGLTDTGTINYYSDINSSWAKNYIDEVTEAGILNGYGDKTFKPENNLTRYELAEVVYNVLKEKSVAGSVKNSITNYKDLNSFPSWSVKAVNYLEQLGVMNDHNGSFDGSMLATRAECAYALDKSLNLIK